MFRSLIDEDLRARSARSGIAHLPEVVGISQTLDAPGIDMLRPDIERLVVAFVYCHPKLLFRQFQHLGHEFPGIGNRIFFEIIAETEIAQHFEKRMVAGRMADILEIVVLAPGTHTGLARSGTRVFRCRNFTRKDRFERDHTRIVKQQCRIFGYQRRTRYACMAFGFKIVQIGFSNVHGFFSL